MLGNTASASGGAAGLTAKVLASRAAAAALLGPAVSAGQWVYRRCAVVATPDDAASPMTVEGWATADHTTAAAHHSRWARPRPIAQPAISYGSLGSLPPARAPWSVSWPGLRSAEPEPGMPGMHSS